MIGIESTPADRILPVREVSSALRGGVDVRELARIALERTLYVEGILSEAAVVDPRRQVGVRLPDVGLGRRDGQACPAGRRLVVPPGIIGFSGVSPERALGYECTLAARGVRRCSEAPVP